MKRKTLFFLLGLLFLVPLSLRAYDFKSGDLYYNITSNIEPYTVEVIGGSGLTIAVIPETVIYNDTTYSVTSIGKLAFGVYEPTTPDTYPKLTSVTIPESVTSIGDMAFNHCCSLTSITIPNSVTSIGYSAFYGVLNIIYHGSATGSPWGAKSINGYVDGYLVFDSEAKTQLVRCSSKATGEIVIPNSVTSIGDYAFYWCSGLTSITIPESVTSIGNYAFSGCSGLTSITIPESVTSIGNYAFYNCTGLTSITIPNSVTSIGSNAFYDVFNIVYYGSATGSPWSAKSINGYVDGYLVFDSEAKTQLVRCSSNATGEIVIPNSVTGIGESAFDGCKGLTSITIPESVTSIGKRAFYDCSGLTSITIPESVTSIGNSAFSGCRGLTSITIPESVTSIGGYAFYDCTGLTSITIPNSVTTIGDWVFYGCKGLTSITIPNSVTSIGESAFRNCSGLTSVTIPDGVTSIGESAFYGCTGLTSITIPESVTSIGSWAFYNVLNIIYHGSATGSPWGAKCVNGYVDGYLVFDSEAKTQLVRCSSNATGEIVIPNSVTGIGESAFDGCESLTSITIPESVTSIGESAFYYCSGLTSVIWNAKNCEDFSDSKPPFKVSPYSWVMANTNITSFIFGNEVEHIPAYLCYGLEQLKSITIPNSVTSIGSGAFSSCYGLARVDYTGTLAEWCAIRFGNYTSNPLYYSDSLYINDVNVTEGVLNIPNGVTSIGNYAFYGCRGLTSITIPESVTSIGESAFYYCSAQTSVVIPESVTSIGNNAFYNVLNIIYHGSATGSPWGAKYMNRYIEGDLVFESEAKTQVVGCSQSATGEIVIPNSVTSIEDYAFSDCSRLTSITIPGSVTSIGNGAFGDCDGLVRVDYTGTLAEWCAIQFGDYTSNPLYCAHNLYIANVNVTKGVLTIPESTTTIGSYAFTHCDSITSIAFPSTLTEMGYGAFDNCAGLTSLTISDNITSIGGFAFNNCSNLTSVTWNAKRCADFNRYQYPFNQCSAITSFSLGDGVEYIPAYLCYGREITSITIPQSVTSIGYLVLGNCPIEYIISLMETPVSLSDNMIGSSRSPQNVLLVVPHSSIPLYQAAAYWKDFAIKTQAFSSHSVTTQTTARVEATYLTTDSATHKRLGYVFAGDTIWNDNAQSDSVSFLIEGLAPSTDYEFCLVADSVWVDEEIKVMADSCDGTQWSEWNSQNGYWEKRQGDYELWCGSNSYGRSDNLSRIVTLDSGVVYTFSIDAHAAYLSSSGSELEVYIGDKKLIDISNLTERSTTYSAIFTPNKTGEYTIRLWAKTVYKSWVDVDNISLTHTLWKTGVYSQCASFRTQAVQFNVSANTTQTTARISLGIDCGDVPVIDRCGFTYYQSGQSDVVDTIFFASTEPVATLDTLITNLTPNKEYYIMPFVDINGTRHYSSGVWSFSTRDISVSLTCGTPTETTIPITFRYDFGDAESSTGINGIEYCLGSQFTDDSDILTIPINSMDSALSLDTIVRGLIPNTQYTFRPYVDVESTGRKYGTVKTARTKSVSLNGSRTDRTQTTLSLQFTYNFGDADIDYIDGNLGDVQSFRFYPASSTGTIDTTFTHLHPGTAYGLTANVVLKTGEACGSTFGTYMTLPVSLGAPSISEYGQTYVAINCDYDYGDATALRNVLEFKQSASDDAAIDTTLSVTNMQIKFTNMQQNTTYYFRHVLEIEEGVLPKPQQDKSYDFENDIDNAHWHFINGTQSNKWVIGTSAGSNGTGGKALYVSSGTSYSYSNTTSTVWAYCDDILSGKVTISFDWKGTGESGYDYMYAYLVPVSANQPTAGSTTAPTGTIQIGSGFNGQSSWTTFTDQERTLTGKYRLYFMWRNDGSTNGSPIAIDNISTKWAYENAGNIILTTDWQEFTTKPITLTTQEADGISNTSALLHGTVDCDQESYTEIGFEWKRSDAPATVKPQRLLVTDRVDENLLFRLEGLSSDRYYDFRTFCSYQGETYYGEWVGLLTSDKEVLVAPTVQTVGATANEQGAEMEGFIVIGTEPILQKGFEVWIKGGTDVKTTVAEGSIIRALIPEPWSYTTYQYKAYAKTASGTTYGETMEVTTGYIPRDVQDIAVTPSSNSAEVTWTEIEVADYYILTLFADEAMTDTLAVYQVGTDGSISRLRMPSAVKALVTCSIEDLTPATDYYFAVVAYNGADQKVAEESGTFATEPAPTGIRQTTDEPSPAVRKILYRGQVLILRGDKVYTLTGQEIR